MTVKGMSWYMAATFVGAVVGAGFASGHEALTFFNTYGIWGLIGIGIVTVGFVSMGACNFTLAQTTAHGSYRHILEITCGTKGARYYDVIVTCFLLAGVGVMLAGAGSLATQQWGLPFLVGVLGTALVVGLSAYVGIGGVLWVNAVLVPGIILFTMSLGIIGLVRLWPSLTEVGIDAFWKALPSPLVPKWWMAAFTYLSYNSLLGIAACIPLAASLSNRKSALWGGVLGGMLLGLLILANTLAIWGAGSAAVDNPVPMAWITTDVHPLLGDCYAIIIWSAMVTTAATNLFAVTKRLGRESQLSTIVGLLILALALSFTGFSALIGLLYPVFGYLGCLYVLQTIIYFVRRWLRRLQNKRP